MIANKSDGRMAVVMPHGVLFRGGEEKACRQRFIKDGILEAVIGLPAGPSYGTGIPGCLLVINKHGAIKRKSVLFINADREYREGKNQNSTSTSVATSITLRHQRRTTFGRTVEGVSSPSVARRISGPWRGGCVYQVNGQRSQVDCGQWLGTGTDPVDEILQSQFPEVLEQIEQETARIAELEGLFAAVSGGDEDEGEAENGVRPKSFVKSLKEEKNNLGGEIKEAKKRIKQMRSDADQLGSGREASELRTEASDMEGEALGKFSRIEEICGPSTP